MSLNLKAALISVHFPKAAGSSLASSYELTLGADRVLRDYDNDPADPCSLINIHPIRYEETKPTTLAPYSAVHGHFHIGRYDRITDAVRTVVLREPIENLISIYYYWNFIRLKGQKRFGNYLYEYFCNNKFCLLEFASIPALRNLMTGSYFRDVDMGIFDIIGDFSDLNSYLMSLTNFIGIEFTALPKINVTPPSDERRALSEDHYTLARLRDLLADDLRFYERYCRR